MELNKDTPLEILREELEDRMSTDCYIAEREAVLSGKKYECKCLLPEKLTRETILHLLGIKDE